MEQFLVTTTRRGVLHDNAWYRPLLQLGGGVLVALVALLVIRAVDTRADSTGILNVSFYVSVIAICGGYYFFRNLISFPGIRASYYILPVFSSSFAVVFTATLLLRLDYSRPLLITSFALAVAWYYLVYFMIQRQPDLTIGVVPFGDVDALSAIPSVNWTRLDDPRLEPRQHHAIVADFRADMPDGWERFLADAALAGSTVFHVKQLRESLTGRVEIEHLSENAYGSLVPDAAYLSAKVALDLVVAIMALVVLSPVLLLIAIFIKFDSPGPVFFRQIRIGYRGGPFRMWKFRSMTHAPAAATDARGHAITRDNDQRVTRVGRVLRRTRLDELPQLINVVACQMSLIGPRPEAEVLSRWYEREIPFYRYRHIVRPGITGWAQVNQGHVAEVADVLEKLHYDFYYISHYSLWLDLLIVLRTLRTMATGFGSK